MLSLEKCRKIEPTLKELSDEDAQKVIESLYDMASLSLESWKKEQSGSNNLEWLLSNNEKGVKYKYE